MKKLRCQVTPLVLLFLLCSLVMPAGIVQANQGLPDAIGSQLYLDSSSSASLDTAITGNKLLQFTSAGHVLGFGSQSVYLGGMGHALKVEFDGARAAQPVYTAGGQEQNGIAPLGTVSYSNVWENIDITYTAAHGGIAESTYIIRPGGNPAAISLSYNRPVEIESSGNLRFTFENGYMTESAPIAWQDIAGERIAVAVAFQRNGDNRIGFALGNYDKEYTLYIDPTYLWHTFYGSGGEDSANALALDSSANIYITGQSGATWNGPAAQAPLNAFNAAGDFVVLKLNSAGAYQWHTFYNGSSSLQGEWGIALDSAANVYTGAKVAATWNGPGGEAPLHAFTAGPANLEVIKLNNAGAYQWHTFYAGHFADIALDSSANAYVAFAGVGYSTTGPAGQAPLHAYTGSSANMGVLKLNSAGAYQWHTYYGGSQDSMCYAIAVDASANVYTTAFTQGASWGSPLNPKAANSHWAWTILKLSSSGAYQWHTFYGGVPNKNDRPYDVAVDASSNVYVTGNLGGDWTGPSGQAPAHAYSGSYDIGILKLDSAGAYQWHTYYGSTAGYEYGFGIAADSTNRNVYVAGLSSETWSNAGPLNAFASGTDMTVLKLYDPPPPPPTTPAPNPNLRNRVLLDESSSPSRSVSSPPSMVVTNLNIQPRQAQVIEPVTIYANIANRGDESGSYTATLKINGQIEQTKTGRVGGRAAVPLKFEVLRDKPGTYTVDINGQQATFVIIDDGGSKFSATTMDWPLIGFFLGAAGVIIMLALLLRRRFAGE